MRDRRLMPDSNRIPPAFRRPSRPAPASSLLESGITRDMLRGPGWQRVMHGYYVQQRTALARDPAVDSPGVDLGRLRLLAITQSLTQGTAAGRTAASLWLHEPLEAAVHVIVPPSCSPQRRPWLRTTRSQLAPDDVTVVEGIPITTPMRTAFDCARLLPLADAVAEVDALLHAGVVDAGELRAYIAAQGRRRGIAQARRVAGLCDARAESRMESRLRVLLILGGLPRPEVNVALYDAQGRFLARVNLYWPHARLAVEYEGDHHRDQQQFRADLARRDALERAGYRVRHVTSRDVYRAPRALVAALRADLQASAAA